MAGGERIGIGGVSRQWEREIREGFRASRPDSARVRIGHVHIAEGFERGSDREFHRFLYIAKGSAGEVRSHLFVAMDLGYVTTDEFYDLRSRAEAASKALSRFISYLAPKGLA